MLVLTAAACQDDRAPKQVQTPAPVEVTAATVAEQRLVITTELPGRTAPFRVAEVRPQVSGLVLERQFQEGSDVAAGEPLYKIDAATYEAALASAEADLAKARASVTSARARAARYRQLAGLNAVSKQDHDDAVAALKQGEAQVAAAEAAVSLARINLDRTVIASPLTGRIGKSAFSEGALVTANQPDALAKVQQLDPIYVDVKQSAAELMALRREIEAGNISASADGKVPVALLLDDGSAYRLPGELQFSDVTVDEGTGSVQLRAVFPNPDGTLLPGLFVRARVDQGVREDAILVPQQAVTRGPDGGALIWLIDDASNVVPAPITTGKAIGNHWLVLDGLKPGDRYVLEGFQKIRPGMAVTSVPVVGAQDKGPGAASVGTPAVTR